VSRSLFPRKENHAIPLKLAQCNPCDWGSHRFRRRGVGGDTVTNDNSRIRRLWLNVGLSVAICGDLGFAGEKGFQVPKPFSAPKTFQSPKGFEIPRPEKSEPVPKPIREPEPVKPLKLELLVPVSSAPLSSPIDASVILGVNGKDSKGHAIQVFGSGTVILSHDGKSTILTCAHNLRGISQPSISVTSQTKLYSGTVQRIDDPNDLALIEVNGELPYVELAESIPKVGDVLTSIGSSASKLEERSHKLTAIDKYDAPKNFETDGKQEPGRSGGGLFFNGELCGVIQGRVGTSQLPIYVSADPIRNLLARQAYGDSQQTEIELWMAPFRCPPCDVLNASVGQGNERVKVVGRYIAPKHWNPSGTFPFVRIKDSKDQWHLYHGLRNLADVEGQIAKLNPPVVSARYEGETPSGVTLNGSAIIQTGFDRLTEFFGDGSEFAIDWTRIGGKDALPANGKYTKKDIFGSSGSISIGVKSTKKLPVNAIRFGYRFGPGSDGREKLFLKTEDEIECEIPETGIVGSGPQKVGIIPIFVAYEVISLIYDVYALFNPTVDVFLGESVSVKSKLSQNVLTVTMIDPMPRLRLNWSFFFGFVKYEYSRDFTGLILSPQKGTIQFHHSHFYRDVSLPIH
jgi:hypothetical protein